MIGNVPHACGCELIYMRRKLGCVNGILFILYARLNPFLELLCLKLSSDLYNYRSEATSQYDLLYLIVKKPQQAVGPLLKEIRTFNFPVLIYRHINVNIREHFNTSAPSKAVSVFMMWLIAIVYRIRVRRVEKLLIST
jgi:hypothetical protein